MKVFVIVLLTLAVAGVAVAQSKAEQDLRNYVSYLKRVGREPNTYLVLEGNPNDSFQIKTNQGLPVVVKGKRIRVTDLDDPVKVNKLIAIVRQPGYKINVRVVSAGANPTPFISNPATAQATGR